MITEGKKMTVVVVVDRFYVAYFLLLSKHTVLLSYVTE